jgi:nitrite reductase/ring-hydroxylating ferredoxin subunit
MPEIFVAESGQLKNGDRRIVKTARGEVGVFKHDDNFYAYSNTCAHSGGPACEGVMIPQVVDIIAEDKTYQGQTFDESKMHFVCPWHGWEYDLKTGASIGDRRLKLRRFEVVQRDGAIYVIA